MRWGAEFIITCALLSSLAFYHLAFAALIPAQDDEFVGPLRGWLNVKTAYGAKGDSITDDTAAFQAALQAVGLGRASPVLWVPAGVYKISTTLVLKNIEGVMVLGEDPTTTIIKWAGPSGGTMLNVSAVSHSRVSRLTFEGSGSAGVAIDNSAIAGGVGGRFDTGNEYSDDFFQNVIVGFQCGRNANGCAEISILRDRFTNISGSAITLGNFNALDVFVRHSIFDHVNIGISNAWGGGAGNFRAYNNIFRNSTTADIDMCHTGQFSVRNNYSIGAGTFFRACGSGNPANVTISGNTILDPTTMIIANGNQGPLLMYDNTARYARGFISAGGFGSDIDAISIGNKFTRNFPYYIMGRFTDIDTAIVSAVDATEPSLPGVEPNFRRQVFEVAAGADAATIQSAITAAAAQSGNRPVVHLAAGSYGIARTIAIPANTDIQLVGDGRDRTRLGWAGQGTGPVLKINGPTKATLRDIGVNGNMKADGIVADNLDQVGSRVFAHIGELSYGLMSNLSVSGLDHTRIELQDSSHGYQTVGGSIGVKVVGGPRAAAGDPQAGGVIFFSGASAGEMMPYDVSNGGNLLVRDTWYESSPSSAYLRVAGRGNVTFEGLSVGLGNRSGATPPTFDIRNLDGKISFINLSNPGKVVVSGDGSKAQVLISGMFSGYLPTLHPFANNTSPTAMVAFINGRQEVVGGGSEQSQSIGVIPGTQLSDGYFQGALDDVRIYNRMLSDSEVAAIYAGAAPATGLRTYWDFNEGTGTTASDVSGNGNTGTLQGGATWTTGKSGSGVALDGVSGYVSPTQKAVYPLNEGPYQDYTISAWVKTTSAAGKPIFSNEYFPTGDGSAVDAAHMTIDPSGRLACNWNQFQGTAAISSAIVNDGAWHLVTCTHTGAGGAGGGVVYVDGMRQGGGYGWYFQDFGGYWRLGSFKQTRWKTPDIVPSSFITSMFAQARNTLPKRLFDLPAGVSDLRMYRVMVFQSLNNMYLTQSYSPPSPNVRRSR